jgi:serine/threonine protein kinase
MTIPAPDIDSQLELDPRLMPGATFGVYRLGRVIGSGGMSSVHEGTHTTLQKRVAIKILHANLALNEALRARFVREGEATSRIRHPNVVNVSDVGTHDGLPYLVMDMLDGESLQQVLNVHRTLDERTLANVIVPVIAGLAASHAAGVLHRDLKPDNVVLAHEADGSIVPKIIDFGVSKLLDVSHGTTAAGSVLGTPHYMAPEVILQRTEIDPRADQYALGVLMYECLAGDVPFDAGSLFELMNLIVAGKCDPLRALRPDVTPELEAIVARAMATDPAKRFPNLRALGSALLPFASKRTRFTYAPAFGVTDDAEPLDEELVNTGQFAIAKLVSKPGSPHAVTRVFTTPDGLGQGTPLPPMAPLPVDVPERAPRSRRGLAAGVIALVALAAVGVYFVLRPAPVVAPSPTPNQVPAFSVRIVPTPADAIVEIDGEIVAHGAFSGAFPVDGRARPHRVRAEGYSTHSSVFRDVAPEPRVVLTRVAPTVVPQVSPVEEPSRAPSSMRTRERPAAPAPAPTPMRDLDIRFER